MFYGSFSGRIPQKYEYHWSMDLHSTAPIIHELLSDGVARLVGILTE